MPARARGDAGVDAEQRRAMILSTAAEMFADRGFAATTMRSIAARVGVLSGSLYHHFESKEAIADELISTYMDELHGRYAVVIAGRHDPVKTLRELIRVSLDVALAHANATIIYQNDGNLLAGMERFRDLPARGAAVQETWLAAFDAGVAAGVLRSDISTRVAYRLMRDGIWRSVRWFHPGPDYPTERFATDCADFYLRAMVAG